MDSFPENIPVDAFTIGGYTCEWMSLEDMEKDERIMEINEEVIAFLNSKCQQDRSRRNLVLIYSKACFF